MYDHASNLVKLLSPKMSEAGAISQIGEIVVGIIFTVFRAYLKIYSETQLREYKLGRPRLTISQSTFPLLYSVQRQNSI
jgi:hypothetical protein